VKKIPLILIQFRLLLCFVIPLLLFFDKELIRIPIVILIFLGVCSDIFDGIIARKLNVATDKIRKWDSNVDSLFTLSILITTYFIDNRLLNFALEIEILVALELITLLFYWLKFKKVASNHAYLTKIFGFFIFINFCMIIGWGNFYFFKPMFVIGLFSYLDGFAILLKMKTWKADNKSFFDV